MQTIQWFPGHMTKTKRVIRENLKKMDFVIEVVDARAPLASQNPLLRELLSQKPRIILLNKSDLSDRDQTKRWMNFFQKEEETLLVLDICANQRGTRATFLRSIESLTQKRESRKGRPFRFLVIGTPNVGKSTFINTLLTHKKAKVENRPGVTQDLQRYVLSPRLELFDTPGMLWHKFEDPVIGMKLALVGNIKESILPAYEVALAGIRLFSNFYPEEISKRYPFFKESVDENPETLLEKYCQIALPKKKGGVIDMEEGARRFLRESRKGLFGTFSTEWVENDFRSLFEVSTPEEESVPEKESVKEEPIEEEPV